MRSEVLVMLVLLATAIVFVPANSEKASSLDISVSEKQFPARVGEPVNWARKGTVQNFGTEAEGASFEFDKKADFTSILIGPAGQDDYGNYIPGDAMETFTKKKGETVDGAKVKIKGHKVKIKFPADQIIYYVIINYEMPAPTMTSSVLQNTATKFLSQFTVATNYDQHTNNVLTPLAVPDLPADWAYEAFVTEADGSKKQVRYYLKDSDGSGGLDEIGVVVPQLSGADGQAGGNLDPGKPKNFLNHRFQQVRADNVNLPVAWSMRQTLDLETTDEYPDGNPAYFEKYHDIVGLAWPHYPFSNEGYDDNSSLIVRATNYLPIFAPPVNATTSFNLNFKYKPGFAADCAWQNGIEVMFPEGPYFSDTTYHFYLWGNGNATNIDSSDILVASSTPDVNGWYDINISRTLDSNGEARVLRYFAMPGANCADTPDKIGEFWIDNTIVTVDQ